MPAHLRRAFTLLELLTVIGVIALLAGGIGLALKEGSPGVALQSAQGTVASLITAARGRAALAGKRTVLAVDADPAGEGFLRIIRIAIETAPNSGQWQFVGDATMLPSGIYLVPGSTTLSGAFFAQDDGAAVGWPAGRLSSLQPAPAGNFPSASGNPAGLYLSMAAPFTALGMADGSGERFVLAAARRAPAGVVFNDRERVRGVVLSSYGVAILINDGAGFDF